VSVTCMGCVHDFVELVRPTLALLRAPRVKHRASPEACDARPSMQSEPRPTCLCINPAFGQVRRAYDRGEISTVVGFHGTPLTVRFRRPVWSRQRACIARSHASPEAQRY
jgi:hypothetical protein